MPKVFEFVENREVNEEKTSLMERLSKIKIDGPPDFAENFDLFMSGEKSLDEYFEKNTK